VHVSVYKCVCTSVQACVCLYVFMHECAHVRVCVFVCAHKCFSSSVTSGENGLRDECLSSDLVDSVEHIHMYRSAHCQCH